MAMSDAAKTLLLSVFKLPRLCAGIFLFSHLDLALALSDYG